MFFLDLGPQNRLRTIHGGGLSAGIYGTYLERGKFFFFIISGVELAHLLICSGAVSSTTHFVVPPPLVADLKHGLLFLQLQFHPYDPERYVSETYMLSVFTTYLAIPSASVTVALQLLSSRLASFCSDCFFGDVFSVSSRVESST